MCSVTTIHAQHPGFDSRRLHNCRDWWLSPVTLLLGDKNMGWSWYRGNPGLSNYNLVELEMVPIFCCPGDWNPGGAERAERSVHQAGAGRGQGMMVHLLSITELFRIRI